MKSWLDGTDNETIITNVNKEEHEEEVQEAIKEQKNTIGWDQFFKGRITTKWSKIQQKVYSKINAERRKQNKTPSSKAFSGQEWWAAKIIKQVVYYSSLNAWQIRNNHLHKEKEQEEYYKEQK